jgi:hypothetical protein
MSRKILLFAIIITLFAMFFQPQNAHAEDHRRITITDIQLSNILRAAPFSQSLTADPVNYREIGVIDGRFMIYFRSRQAVRNAPDKFYYIWLKPELHDGRIGCTIDQIRVDGKLLTQKELMQSNPYLSDLNGDSYCNSLLNPFLVGFGPGAVINSISLPSHYFVIDLGGTLAPDAPSPVVVGGCKIYTVSWFFTLNLRSGPGLDYPVLTVIESFDEQSPVLDWRGDWLKINFKGTVGWVWKYYVYGTGACLPDYSNSSEAWLRSDAP